jgi:hypothetical protein
MKRVIIESPYSSGTDPSLPLVVARNVRYVRACLRDCLLRGEAPFASHAIYTLEGVLDDHDPQQRRLGMEAGFAWAKGTDRTAAAIFIAVYTDLGVSSGMQSGLERHKSLGLAVKERSLGPPWTECQCCAEPIPIGPEHMWSCPFWRNRS